MKNKRFGKVAILLMLVASIAACDQESKNGKKLASPQTSATEEAEAVVEPETVDLKKASFERNISGVSLAGLSVQISGGTDVDYANYQNSVLVQAGAPRFLSTSSNVSRAVFENGEGIVLSFKGLEFTTVESFEQMLFSKDLPKGATVAVYNGTNLLSSTQIN